MAIPRPAVQPIAVKAMTSIDEQTPEVLEMARRMAAANSEWAPIGMTRQALEDEIAECDCSEIEPHGCEPERP